MTGFNLAALDDVVARAQANSGQPKHLILSPAGAAFLDTMAEIEPLEASGANWRRIKRERRKAYARNLAKRRAAQATPLRGLI